MVALHHMKSQSFQFGKQITTSVHQAGFYWLLNMVMNSLILWVLKF